jgi:leucyl aminopeptidase
MQFQLVLENDKRKVADIAILPYWKEEKKMSPAFLKGAFSSEVLPLLEKDFTANCGELLFSYDVAGLEKKILLVGLGSRKESNSATLRKAYALVLQACRKKKLESLNLFLPQDLDLFHVEAILDALSQANYSYDYLKRESLIKNPTSVVKKVNLVGARKDIEPLIKKMGLLMDGVNLTRDLVNGNADDVTPTYLVNLAKSLAKTYSSIEVKVLGQKELEKEKMGLMLAVNRGSNKEPALIIINYKGDPQSKDVTAIVGKGVTYDTGGLNLKPTGSMEDMKIDMGGSATVMGVMQACAALKLKKNVIGVIGSVENAIDANSYKPGDVFISHSGKSVEITNTDAEGRLVLADAFSYVQKHYPLSRMIDFATLTGGVLVALGEEASGLFSNNKKVCDQVKKAADVTGERVWELPLYPEYLDAFKSPIADLTNCSKNRKASSATAATFLHQFVENDLPWAHLDIAGTAYTSKSSAYNPSLATGYGVKLMIEFLQSL